jgi:hypothetical protein
LERLRKNNRARRQQLNEDMNSRIQEPLLVSAPLASSAELLAYSAVLLQSTPQSAHFVDWSNHTDDADAFYFSFQDNAYIQILSEPLPEDSPPMPSTSLSVEGYRAITENVPKTFPQALRDPVWGDPCARPSQKDRFYIYIKSIRFGSGHCTKAFSKRLLGPKMN